MKRMLFNATYQEELRVATVEGQRLINFDIETTAKAQRRGNIYKGFITRVEPSLEACFVDYGPEKQGFLPFKEIDVSYLPESSRHRDFARLPEGTELIIQVEKDERGNKGAALTTYVSLPGRYLVLMPNNIRGGGISRRIDGEERDELKAVITSLEVPDGMSIIARTAALGRVQEELQWDLNYLIKLWDAITKASASHDGSFLVYPESSLVIRSIRDHFSPDITEILIDMKDIFEQAHQFMSHVMPTYVDRVKFYQDDVPLFSRFQIEHQIESAFSRSVHLPSGGSIVIDHTEALTAVDVNSAKANKGVDIEATALATNLEAAEEISRQMRLRDLGGLIVVDFIDMENVRNQREVENFFKNQLGLDRARIQMGKLSKFGLLELSRQRLQASLEESTTIACPRCDGVGVIRGTETTAVHILRIIQEEVLKNANFISALHVQLPVSVATYLLNEKREDVASIESRTKIKILLIPNIHLETPNYKIRKISSSGYDIASNRLSFNLVDSPEETQMSNQAYGKRIEETSQKGLVRDMTPSIPAPVIKIKGFNFNNLFNKVFKAFNIVGKPKDLTKSSMTNTPVLPHKPLNSVKSQIINKTVAQQPIAKPYNKTRPVGVNRSNTKVQTVRPNQQTARPALNPNNPKFTENRRPSNPSNINEPRKTEQFPDKSQIIQPAKVIPTKTFEEATIPKILPTQVSVPVKEVIAYEPIVIKREILKVRENTIVHPVDLGQLQMVATRNELVNNMKSNSEDKSNLKRYNDNIPEEKAIVKVDYQLIETKVN